jgi:serine/threonine protein phosphatase PrpC
MRLDGLGRRFLWPTGAGCYSEDDFCFEPRLGLAVVARGMGAIGGQGKPASKLLVWSLAGEIGAWEQQPSPAEARMRRGLLRAKVAVERLSGNWPSGLMKPGVLFSALLLDGGTAIIAHIGDCRVSRVHPGGLEALTRDHTVGAEFPHEAVPEHMAHLLTRTLGGHGEPEVRRIPLRPGDVFLLATRDVHETLSDQETARALEPFASSGEDPAAAIEALVDLLKKRRADGAKPTLAIARATDGPCRPATCGSPEAPRLPWLFAPGAPLEDPPAQWRPGTTGRGPDSQWFSEVFRGVMGDSE